MASLRYSAAEGSEDTLNSFTSHTTTRTQVCDRQHTQDFLKGTVGKYPLHQDTATKSHKSAHVQEPCRAKQDEPMPTKKSAASNTNCAPYQELKSSQLPQKVVNNKLWANPPSPSLSHRLFYSIRFDVGHVILLREVTVLLLC